MRESVHDCDRRRLDIPMSTAKLHLPDAAATEAAGARLAPALAGGMIVTLSGDLGAGQDDARARVPACARLDRAGEEPELSVG